MTVLYLIRAACPTCGSVSEFVEKSDEPIDLMQDVGVSRGFCPYCGGRVWEWDVHEEAEIERVEPTDPYTTETDRSGGDGS